MQATEVLSITQICRRERLVRGRIPGYPQAKTAVDGSGRPSGDALTCRVLMELQNLPTRPFKDRRDAETLMLHAIHEAGHYTIARLLRRLYPAYIRRVRIGNTTIVQVPGVGGSVAGRVFFRQGKKDLWVDDSLTLVQKEPRVLFDLAGVAAETLWQHLDAAGKSEGGIGSLRSAMKDLKQRARERIGQMEGEDSRTKLQRKHQKDLEDLEDLGKLSFKLQDRRKEPLRPDEIYQTDMEKVRGHLGPRDLVWVCYYVKALREIYKNWKAVLRVARAVSSRRTISAREAHSAFKGSEEGALATLNPRSP